MPLQATCQSCGKNFAIPSNLSPSQVKCKSCGGKLYHSGISTPSEELAEEIPTEQRRAPKPLIRSDLPPSEGQRWVIGTAWYFFLFLVVILASVILFTPMLDRWWQSLPRISIFSPQPAKTAERVQQQRSGLFEFYF